MIALLCALLGLGTSFVPKLLGCFKKNQANQQELAMREATVKYAAWLSIFKKSRSWTRRHRLEGRQSYMLLISCSTAGAS